MTRVTKESLTPRQREILDWVKAFIRDNSMPPTVREIGSGFGIKSSSVFELLQTLERKGYLRRGELGARSLIVEDAGRRGAGRGIEVPILGRVPAGQFVEEIEHDRGTVVVSPSLLQGRPGFALEVEGESMIDDGILDGDCVVVRKQEAAENGDAVIALLGDEVTLKRFYRERGGVRLEPANGRMRAIHVKNSELRIQGKVVGVVRVMGAGRRGERG